MPSHLQDQQHSGDEADEADEEHYLIVGRFSHCFHDIAITRLEVYTIRDPEILNDTL